MPLPEIEYHAEEVTIKSTEYGWDDRGIPTCTVFCEWSGNLHGFDHLILDEKTRPGEKQEALAARSDLAAERDDPSVV